MDNLPNVAVHSAGVSRFMSMVRQIPGIDVDEAVAALGVSEDLYRKMFNMLVRMLPEYQAKMEGSFDADDWKAFALTAHAVRGSLNQVGNRALGKCAEKLELAAASGDRAYCVSHYGEFRESLLSFYNAMKIACDEDAPSDAGTKSKGDIREYDGRLESARAAADDFERGAAMEALSPLTGFCFGEPYDEWIAQAVDALEVFNVTKALELVIMIQDAIRAAQGTP